MRSAHRLRSLVVPDGDGYGLARVVVAVRVAVVLSIVVLVATGPGWMRHHTGATAAVLGGSLVYAAVLLARPQFEVRRTRYSWLVAAVDATLTLTLIALTGGTASPVAVVLVLAVVAAAARLRFVECLMFASMVGAGYVLVVLVSGSDPDAVLNPPVQGLWWALYLVFIAVLTGGLSVLAEREHRSRVHALVEAEAEHAAAEEERDLRARLLRSYENQQEGLQVVLHEFRTPIASLDALAAALTDAASPMTPTDRDAAIALAGRHAQHLTDMLDALADVALSRRPTFSSGRVRRVDVAALIGEAGDAAGVQPPRLRVEVTGNLSAVQVDAQGLRRVLTNLLENAARHGRGLPIDVQCLRADDLLVVSVLDRGPGVPQENLGELTEKWISLSDRRGTAGLGLWIAQQIIDALDGTLAFSARDGGGLAATFSVPIG